VQALAARGARRRAGLEQRARLGGGFPLARGREPEKKRK